MEEYILSRIQIVTPVTFTRGLKPVARGDVVEKTRRPRRSGSQEGVGSPCHAAAGQEWGSWAADQLVVEYTTGAAVIWTIQYTRVSFLV